MTQQPRWSQAENAAAEVRRRPSARRTLLLLARLPLLHERALQCLAGLRVGATVYRSLRLLKEMGLIGAVRPPLRAGPSPHLYYLTDLGLATVAFDQRVDPTDLARRNHLGGDDLLALVPGLPHLVATYDLLAEIAACLPSPNLLAWERPWRRRYRRHTKRQPISVTLPAYIALASEGTAGGYLLIPDGGGVPLSAYRATVSHLFPLRGSQVRDFPTVVISTPGPDRALAWERRLEEERRRRNESPLRAAIFAASDRSRVRPELTTLLRSSALPPQTLVRRIRVRPFHTAPSARSIRRYVGDALIATSGQPRQGRRRGAVALRLTHADRKLLDVVSRHPFLPLGDLATVLGWSSWQVRKQRDKLMTAGILRLAEESEVGGQLALLELAELTGSGLEIAAAQQGLSVAAAVRWNGVAGGGPEQEIGSRRKLLQTITHTIGADRVFARLYGMAREMARSGGDDAVLDWRNAAACSSRHFRPDGYGVFRHAGERYGFFLEYDRGTMSLRDYAHKFGAYYDYWLNGRFQRDYDGFPTILVVTTSSVAEERIARAARLASIGRGVKLPLLLTCLWQDGDHRNPHSLLGKIWREQDARFGDRRLWPRPAQENRYA